MNTQNIRAIKNSIIVEPIEKDSTTKGGIVLPDMAQDSPIMYGKVLSVGREVEDVKVGDVIVFDPLPYDEVTDNRIAMRVDDVYGVLENEDN